MPSREEEKKQQQRMPIWPEQEDDDDDDDDVNVEHEPRLTQVEMLNLGCMWGFGCHPLRSFFALDPGRPSTNGVLAYNLKDDLSSRHFGALRPAFTAAYIVVEKDGYLVVQGGFSSQFR
jgi:hypothetical protein